MLHSETERYKWKKMGIECKIGFILLKAGQGEEKYKSIRDDSGSRGHREYPGVLIVGFCFISFLSLSSTVLSFHNYSLNIYFELVDFCANKLALNEKTACLSWCIFIHRCSFFFFYSLSLPLQVALVYFIVSL